MYVYAATVPWNDVTINSSLLGQIGGKVQKIIDIQFWECKCIVDGIFLKI